MPTTTSSVIVGPVEAVVAAWCDCPERYREGTAARHKAGTLVCSRCGRLLEAPLPEDDEQAGKTVSASMARYSVGLGRRA